MSCDNLRFTYAEREYEWHGGFGAVIKSFNEPYVEKGTVREIAGRLFYAYVIYPGGLLHRREVGWTLIGDELTVENIRKFRDEVFG